MSATGDGWDNHGMFVKKNRDLSFSRAVTQVHVTHADPLRLISWKRAARHTVVPHKNEILRRAHIAGIEGSDRRAIEDSDIKRRKDIYGVDAYALLDIRYIMIPRNQPP